VKKVREKVVKLLSEKEWRDIPWVIAVYESLEILGERVRDEFWMWFASMDGFKSKEAREWLSDNELGARMLTRPGIGFVREKLAWRRSAHPLVRECGDLAQYGFIFARGYLNPKVYAGGKLVAGDTCALCGQEDGSTDHLMKRCRDKVVEEIKREIREKYSVVFRRQVDMCEVENWFTNVWGDEVIMWGDLGADSRCLRYMAEFCKRLWTLHVKRHRKRKQFRGQ